MLQEVSTNFESASVQSSCTYFCDPCTASQSRASPKIGPKSRFQQTVLASYLSEASSSGRAGEDARVFDGPLQSFEIHTAFAHVGAPISGDPAPSPSTREDADLVAEAMSPTTDDAEALDGGQG